MENRDGDDLNSSNESILKNGERLVNNGASGVSEMTTTSSCASSSSERKFRCDSDEDSEEDISSEDEETRTDAVPTSLNILQRMKSLLSRIILAAVGPSDTDYNMNHAKRGKCIIFNHFRYDSCLGLPKRKGTEKDVERIKSTFSAFGFDVILHEDLKWDEIMKCLKAVSKEDHSNNDCLAVFVLTHGHTDQLFAFDLAYKPSELWYNFTAQRCPTLATKPKMFFIQACRGDQFDKGTKVGMRSVTVVDSPTTSASGTIYNTYRIPNQADFLIVYSTFEGHYSFRSKDTGSCFVPRLCSVFKDQHAKRDVISMMTLVNFEVAKYKSKSRKRKYNNKKQMSQFSSTLTRFLYLKDKN